MESTTNDEKAATSSRTGESPGRIHTTIDRGGGTFFARRRPSLRSVRPVDRSGAATIADVETASAKPRLPNIIAIMASPAAAAAATADGNDAPRRRRTRNAALLAPGAAAVALLLAATATVPVPPAALEAAPSASSDVAAPRPAAEPRGIDGRRRRQRPRFRGSATPVPDP
ncbi:hypothetical protein ACHAWF_000268, partial [Thalassiosira exigua]